MQRYSKECVNIWSECKVFGIFFRSIMLNGLYIYVHFVNPNDCYTCTMEVHETQFSVCSE